jgi:hypothetical protein
VNNYVNGSVNEAELERLELTGNHSGTHSSRIEFQVRFPKGAAWDEGLVFWLEGKAIASRMFPEKTAE